MQKRLRDEQNMLWKLIFIFMNLVDPVPANLGKNFDKVWEGYLLAYEKYFH